MAIGASNGLGGFHGGIVVSEEIKGIGCEEMETLKCTSRDLAASKRWKTWKSRCKEELVKRNKEL